MSLVFCLPPSSFPLIKGKTLSARFYRWKNDTWCDCSSWVFFMFHLLFSPHKTWSRKSSSQKDEIIRGPFIKYVYKNFKPLREKIFDFNLPETFLVNAPFSFNHELCIVFFLGEWTNFQFHLFWLRKSQWINRVGRTIVESLNRLFTSIVIRRRKKKPQIMLNECSEYIKEKAFD